MRITSAFRVLAGLIVLAVAAVIVNTYRLGRSHARLAADLVADARTEPGTGTRTETGANADETFDPGDVEGLPAPVRRYFETVLDEGQPLVHTVRLEQRGEIRLGGADAEWKPLEATQHYTVDPPGFVWDATIDVAPLLPARVVDAYANGEGFLRGKLLSTITVVDVGPDSEMNESELVRYLAETPWFPTALLPAAGVEWEPIDDHSARATIEHDGNVASVVFHFDDDDLITRVTADRYRREDDSEAPWTGTFRAYEERNGRLSPTEAEVAWDLAESEVSYWRASIEDIDHR
ncbi:MAG: hypothetical protein ACI9YT_000875 [Halobacteriales archaeon]|jgi:hypothetical protein